MIKLQLIWAMYCYEQTMQNIRLIKELWGMNE